MRLVKLLSLLTSITILFIGCVSEHKLEKATTQQVSLTVNGMT